MPEIVASPASYLAFLDDVARGEFPRAKWNHAAHLAFAAHILFEQKGYDGVRAGILAYNATQGIVSTPDSGYHETVTRFWCDRILELPPQTSAFELAALAVSTLTGQLALIGQYYSFDVIKSREARATYSPPDRV
ncbi:MAG: hypothetical protein FJW30_28445 [Acidobacteria bacterium]|nr:hypothetical protein [Acidobacteriota bacterium]